jgi:hypothetical protein
MRARAVAGIAVSCDNRLPSSLQLTLNILSHSDDLLFWVTPTQTRQAADECDTERTKQSRSTFKKIPGLPTSFSSYKRHKICCTNFPVSLLTADFTCGFMLILVRVLDFYTVWKWSVLLMFQRYTLSPVSGLKRLRSVSFCEYIYFFSKLQEETGLVPCCFPYWAEWVSSPQFSSGSYLKKKTIYKESHPTQFDHEDGRSTYHWNFGTTAHSHTM